MLHSKRPAVGAEKYTSSLNGCGGSESLRFRAISRVTVCTAVRHFNVAPEDRDVHDPELCEDEYCQRA